VKPSVLLSLLAFLLTCLPAEVAGHVNSEWIAFRYDSSHVLFYICKSTAAKLAIQSRRNYPDPIARWGQGGYIIDPQPEMLRSGNCEEEVSVVPLNYDVGIRLDSSSSVHAVVEKYVAQWGASAPDVQVGVLAKIRPADLLRFRASKAYYFLAYTGGPLIAEDLQRLAVPIRSKPHELSNLGSAGRILLYRGDAGWVVAICKIEGGRLVSTAVRYEYGE
jgi:hypothetical protein